MAEDIEYWEMKNERAAWQMFYGTLGYLVGIAYVVAQWVPLAVPAPLSNLVSPVAEAAAPIVTSGDMLSSSLIAVLLILWSSVQIDNGLVTRRYYKKLVAKDTQLKDDAPTASTA